jgi:hypothetical protein
MSSTRRTANEIHILAMLDRREAAGLPQRLLRGMRALPATTGSGAAGVLVCALVGALAWLAHDDDSPAADSALAGAVTVKPAAAIAEPPEPASRVVPDEVPESEPDPVPGAGAGAAIVEAAPAPATRPDEPDDPAEPLHPLPPQQHAGRIAPQEFARDPQRLAAHAAAGKGAARAAAGKAPAAGARTAALSRTEPRHKRPASLPKTAPEPVDTDVALISAIIQHANKRQEAEDAALKP